MNLKDFAFHVTSTAEKIPEKFQVLASTEAPMLLMDVNYFTPVKSGALKQGNKVIVDPGSTITIKNDLDYAAPVEWGHRTKGGSFVQGQYFVQKGISLWKQKFAIRQKNFLSEIYRKNIGK